MIPFKFEEYGHVRSMGEAHALAANYAWSRGRGLVSWGSEYLPQGNYTIIYGELAEGSEE